MPSPARFSAQSLQMLDDLDGLSAVLAALRRNTGVRLAEWGAKGGENELVIELGAVLAEADGLSRLIDSIVDGTEESVPIEDLRERFVRVLMKIDGLRGRWQSRGLERG